MAVSSAVRFSGLRHPPVCIEVMSEIDGATIDDCRAGRFKTGFDGIPVSVIRLTDLRRNKTASA